MKLLLLCTPADEPYLHTVNSIVGIHKDVTLKVYTKTPGTLTEITLLAKKHNFDGFLVTNIEILKKLVGLDMGSAEATINNYAGSLFSKLGYEWVILNPLKQLRTVPYGRFLFDRYLSKFTNNNATSWPICSAFRWSMLTPRNEAQLFDLALRAELMAVDIETTNTPVRRITYCGYCLVLPDGQSFSVVLKLDSMWAVHVMRKWNMLPAPKVLQNGKYDINWLLAWGAPLENYLFDTANLFHCWYSELPKDLGFLQAFFVREAAYWKDLAKVAPDEETYCLYNAKDTWATAMTCIALVNQMPLWARHNYENEFPLNFPCILSELTGIARDRKVLLESEKQQKELIAAGEAALNRMLGFAETTKHFNTASTKQMEKLFTVLGCADIYQRDKGSEKARDRVAFRHPLNARIMEKINEIQEAKKLASTYLITGENPKKPSKDYNGVVLYGISPTTDTSRMASKEHHFWCGANIQNIPRGNSLPKQSMVPYPGFRLAECDLEQAESRDTAYAAGEERLIAAVSGEKDFHSLNAASFFGCTYEDIYDIIAKKVKDKDRRELGKKVNHGANYLMGAMVLVQTMGEKNVFKAARLLGLPTRWTAMQIAEYLLKQFHKTYPGLEGIYYPAVVKEIVMTRMLKSKAKQVMTSKQCLPELWNLEYQQELPGLVRYCFDNPMENKRAKNAYVAHVSQSLNAMNLNKAYMLVFYNIAINPRYAKHFKLCAQIHDSILFQFREGHEYLAELVRECMEIPVRITAYTGKDYEFTVPAAIKAGKDGKGALNWGDI